MPHSEELPVPHPLVLTDVCIESSDEEKMAVCAHDKEVDRECSSNPNMITEGEPNGLVTDLNVSKAQF